MMLFLFEIVTEIAKEKEQEEVERRKILQNIQDHLEMEKRQKEERRQVGIYICLQHAYMLTGVNQGSVTHNLP